MSYMSQPCSAFHILVLATLADMNLVFKATVFECDNANHKGFL